MSDAVVCLATSANSITLGALLFAGVVDGRTLLQIVGMKDEGGSVSKAITSGFEKWWPNGATLMIPLVSAAFALNIAAYIDSKKKMWLAASLSHACIMGWTGAIMGRHIKFLMNGSGDAGHVREAVRSFVTLHTVRIGLAAAGVYSGSLALLSNLRASK